MKVKYSAVHDLQQTWRRLLVFTTTSLRRYLQTYTEETEANKSVELSREKMFYIYTPAFIFQPVARIYPFFCSRTSLSFPSFLPLFKRRAWKTSLLQKLWSGVGRGQALSIRLVLPCHALPQIYSRTSWVSPGIFPFWTALPAVWGSASVK